MSTSSVLATTVAALLLLLLLAASSSVGPAPAAAATAAASSRYGGGRNRMVLIHGPGSKVAVGARNGWHHYHLPRVEDEVAPEPELGAVLATNSNGGRISTGALDKNRPGCQSGNQCAAKSGGSYTRPCTYASRCPHSPS